MKIARAAAVAALGGQWTHVAASSLIEYLQDRRTVIPSTINASNHTQIEVTYYALHRPWSMIEYTDDYGHRTTRTVHCDPWQILGAFY